MNLASNQGVALRLSAVLVKYLGGNKWLSKLLIVGAWVICSLPMIASAQQISEDAPQATDPTSGPIESLSRLSFEPQDTQLTQDQLPQIEVLESPANQNAYFVQRSELPIVDIRLTFNAGSARDPEIDPKALGLSNITAAMLSRGTDSLSENQIAAVLEQYGIDLAAASYKDMFVVSLRTLSTPEALSTGIDLMMQIITEPSFDQSALERTIAQSKLSIAQASKNPGYIASRRFYSELYPNHPYGNPSNGTEQSLDLITPELLQTFGSTYLVASNANLAMTGDLSLSQAQQISRHIYRSLPSGNPPSKLPKPQMPKPKVVWVEFDSEQTHITAGQLALDRSSNVLTDLTLANQVLGGGMFSAVLMDELRRKRGLTYGAYSSLSSMQTTGPWAMSFSTQNSKALQALEVADEVTRQYLQNGPTAEQIAEVKTMSINQFALSIASNSDINSWLAMMGFYDLGADYINQRSERIEAVSKDSATSALKQTLDASNMIWVIVGPKKGTQSFDPTLKSSP